MPIWVRVGTFRGCDFGQPERPSESRKDSNESNHQDQHSRTLSCRSRPRNLAGGEGSGTRYAGEGIAPTPPAVSLADEYAGTSHERCHASQSDRKD